MRDAPVDPGDHAIGVTIEQQLRGGRAELRSEHAVISHGGTAPLHVTQGHGAGLHRRTLVNQVGHDLADPAQLHWIR